MAQEKYDIFISYRRRDKEGNEWGTPIARNIQQALESRGYMGRVFFDHNEIGPEDFEEKILGAIKQSKVFICVLTKDAMDNCVREGDWVRREICQAIESKKKMIFLNPDNQFTYNFPVDFPEELRIVRKGNSIDIRMGQKFELDMDDMVNTHIASIIKPSYMVKRTPVVENNESVVVRIKSDLDCRIFNCGEELCVAKAGRYTTIQLPLGENELRFEGLECVEDSYEQFIEIDDNHQRIIRVSLLEKYNARKKREAYLLSLDDSEFCRWSSEEGKLFFKLKTTGEVAFSSKYDNAGRFHGGLAKVILNGKEGFIDKTGKEIVPIKYDYISSFRDDGLAEVELNGKVGFIDKTGKEIVPIKYDYIYFFRDHRLTIVQLNDKYGVIDKTGKEIIPLIYDNAKYSYRGWVRIRLNGKDSFVNENGIVEGIEDVDVISFFGELGDLLKIRIGNKFGCVDEDNRIIIPCIYDEISALRKMKDSFLGEDDLCGVRIGNAMGVIDASGKILIPCKYDDFGEFKKNELVRVRLDGKWGYVDTSRGVEIVPCDYDELWALVDGMIPIRKSDKWGYLNDRGEEVIPCIYDKVQPFKNKFAKVCLNGEWFLIDKNGNKVE